MIRRRNPTPALDEFARDGVTSKGRQVARELDRVTRMLKRNPSFRKSVALGYFARMLRETTSLIAWDPRNESAYIQRAGVRLRVGDARGAIADCTRALRISPRSVRALCARAAALSRHGRHADAIADYTLAL